MVVTEKQESVLTGSKKSHSPTIIAAACLLLVGCTQSTRQAGQTARPVTTAPAQIADRGPSEPRFADMAGEPIDLASLPAEPVAVDRAPPPPTPKPRQSLIKPAPSVPNPAAVEIKPAPSVPNPAAVEIKPAAGPTSTGPSTVAPAASGFVQAGLVSLFKFSECLVEPSNFCVNFSHFFVMLLIQSFLSSQLSARFAKPTVSRLDLRSKRVRTRQW